MATKTAYRRALAYALDDLELGDVTAGTTTTVTVAAFINAAAVATSGLYEGRRVFNTTTLTQTRVSAYVPGTGVLTTTPSSTAGSAGQVIELTSLFPVTSLPGAAETSYNTLVARALGRMKLAVPVSIAITTSDRYSMTSYPSLVRAEQLTEVREPSPISGRSPVRSDRGWRLIEGTPPYLQTEKPFLTASGSLEVEWTRQASTWIAVSNVWAESTIGLNAESDQAIPTVEDFLPFALEEALTVLIARAPGRPNAEWARLLKQAQDDVARSPYRDPDEQPAAPVQAA